MNTYTVPPDEIAFTRSVHLGGEAAPEPTGFDSFSSLVPQLRALDGLPGELLPATERAQAAAALQLILDGVVKQMNDRCESRRGSASAPCK
jgi:hypothetical protein